MTKIEINSQNYSGQVADITFYPQTGGTIYIGQHIIPYEYDNDYYYGTYSLFFPFYGQVCELIVVAPTPTPTPSVTPYSTPTPTPSPSPIYYYYYLLNCDGISNAFGRSSLPSLTGTYNINTNVCYTIVGTDLGPYYDYDLDTSLQVNDCTDISCLPTESPTPTPTPTITPTMTPSGS